MIIAIIPIRFLGVVGGVGGSLIHALLVIAAVMLIYNPVVEETPAPIFAASSSILEQVSIG